MILIVSSLNVTPEDEVNERLEPLLKEGYRVVSATTSMALHGNMEQAPGFGPYDVNVARHVYYVTTVVLQMRNIDGSYD